MKKVTSENGYALVVTLLVFTILMILGASIWGIIINNSKQIHRTETDIQSTDLAEMGFVYNYTVINDTYSSLEDNLKTFIKGTIEADIAKNFKPTEEDYYTKIAIEKLYSLLTEKLKDEKKLVSSKVVDLEGNNEFTISKHSEIPSGMTIENIENITFLLDGANHKISILFISTGSTGTLDSDSSKSLKLSYDIKLNSVKVTYQDGDTGGGGTGSGGGAKVDLESVITKPDLTKLPSCKSDYSRSCASIGDVTLPNNKASIYGSTIYIDGKLDISKNNSTITNSTLYITGNFEAEKITSISNSKIHVDGSSDAYIKDIASLTNKSIIEIGGDIGNETTSTSIGYVNNSILKIKEDAFLHDMNKGFENNSKLIVGGNLVVSTTIHNFNNSFIKVYGDASFGTINSSSNSQICVFGSLIKIGTYPSTVKVYTKASTDPITFKNKCGSIEDKNEIGKIDFEWDVDTDIEYQYDYD